MPFSTTKFVALAATIPSLVLAACPGPDVNNATLNFVKSYESWQPDVYDDGYGNPSVGYGHLCKDSKCSDVKYDIPLSKSDGLKLFADDLTSYQNGVASALKSSVKLNDNQYGALVSWCFNVGAGAVKSSNLVERLNAGDDADTVAEEELPKWKYANGEVSEGLLKRRKAEVKLFKKSSKTEALPADC